MLRFEKGGKLDDFGLKINSNTPQIGDLAVRVRFLIELHSRVFGSSPFPSTNIKWTE